jgi:hypothetical protein
MTKEESSSIENRSIVSPIEKREWTSCVEKKAGEELVSQNLSALNPCDPAYAHSIKNSGSRGKTLVKSSSSLKNAFILSEILERVVH